VTVGIAGTLAQDILNILRNAAPTLVATPFIQLHTGDPGAAGTSNVSVGCTTRNAIVWNAATTGGVMTMSTLSLFTNAGTSETITHVSIWTASSAGTFKQSGALTASQAWVSTNTLTFNTLTLNYTPIAA
jgi:hypothetical protein